MNHIPLEYLEEMTKHKRRNHKFLRFFREIRVMLVIFVCCSIGMTIFTNANLFARSLQDTFTEAPIGIREDVKENMYEDANISSIMDAQTATEQYVDNLVQEAKEEIQIESKKNSFSSDEYLFEKVKEYEFKFNTLPPTNRLIIPKFGVDDPIITSKFTEVKDFTNTNFNTELVSGVVKYPTTPAPGNNGNTFIFGHTSQEWWKKNPYGMAFAHIAKTEIGDMIQVIRDSQLYEYKVVDIQIVYPQHVNEVYTKYHKLNKGYLTLMGCYPIGTAKQRILVIAEEIKH